MSNAPANGLGPAPVRTPRLPPPSRSRASRTATCSLIAAAGFTTVCLPALALAEPTETVPVFTKDIRHSALTAAPGMLEFGLFSYGRYTLNDHVEVALHPIAFFLWPEVEAKVRWLDVGPFTFATAHSLSYPTWFMDLSAREGTGGLLDPNSDLPPAFQVDLGILATWRLGPSSWATLHPRAQVRAGKELPVLEFPFLYQRLTAANAGWLVALDANLEGLLGESIGYEFGATYSHLPLASVEGAFAVEAVVEARLLLSQKSTLPIGLRFAHAKFPYGRQSHWLPYLDYRFVW